MQHQYDDSNSQKFSSCYQLKKKKKTRKDHNNQENFKSNKGLQFKDQEISSTMAIN